VRKWGVRVPWCDFQSLLYGCILFIPPRVGYIDHNTVGKVAVLSGPLRMGEFFDIRVSLLWFRASGKGLCQAYMYWYCDNSPRPYQWPIWGFYEEWRAKVDLVTNDQGYVYDRRIKASCWMYKCEEFKQFRGIGDGAVLILESKPLPFDESQRGWEINLAKG
jgi:hypothetical protein